MSETWFISDTHLGHKNIITFVDKVGQKIRPFSTIEEHDETILANFNKLVSPKDRVYFMGDVAINRNQLPQLARFNGRKKLIKGNHDIFKLVDYTPYFEDILACRTYPDQGLIVSHIPVHTSQLENRWKANAHGHTHINLVMEEKEMDTGIGVITGWYEDKRYLNMCLEHTYFKPVNFDELVKRIPNGKLE